MTSRKEYIELVIIINSQISLLFNNKSLFRFMIERSPCSSSLCWTCCTIIERKIIQLLTTSFTKLSHFHHQTN